MQNSRQATAAVTIPCIRIQDGEIVDRMDIRMQWYVSNFEATTTTTSYYSNKETVRRRRRTRRRSWWLFVMHVDRLMYITGAGVAEDGLGNQQDGETKFVSSARQLNLRKKK